MSVPDVLARIRDAEAQSGRPPGSARLVAVTKGQDTDAIARAVLTNGAFPLGEGRAQELRDKAAEFTARGMAAEWHYIGPLQRNKVKYLKPVALVHAIEAEWQAEAIAQAAAGWGHAPDVLLQLHNGEAQKHGIPAAELPGVLKAVRDTGLTVRGLMVMAPDVEGEGAEATIRAVFRGAAQRAHDLGLSELSMGMSGDYPLAVQEGATLVRVGRSLFT